MRRLSDRFRYALALFLSCIAMAPLTSSGMIDLDTDGLDDIWQELFGAQALLPGDDEDGDDSTNLEECIAGTDPFDYADCHDVDAVSGDGTSASITFDSLDGKCYRVQAGTALTDFADIGDDIHGTGSPITVGLSTSGAADLTGSVTHEVWTGVAGTTVADLTGHASYPNSPSGTEALGKAQTASNLDDGYGGRILGFIKPPANGSYTFYLASRDESEFWLSTDDTPGNLVLQASVSGGAVGPEEWTRFASQTSGAITLVGGQKYYFEVLHKHGDGEDHCALGWEGPGLPAGTQVVDGAFLCPVAGSAAAIAADFGFIRVVVKDLDQDGDGISDFNEKLMSGEGNYSPYDPNSTSSGSDDITTVTAQLGASSETIEVVAADAEAYEDPRTAAELGAATPVGDVGTDQARFRVVRTGTLQPVTVSISLGGTLKFPGESADGEGVDYNAVNLGGGTVTSSVSLGFGQVSADIIVTPIHDTDNSGLTGIGNEWPEGLSCTVNAGAYTTGAGNEAEVTIFDALDIDEQEVLFVAYSSPEPGSIGPQGSAIVSGQMNGKKDFMKMNTVISAGFSSPQDDSHVHKADGPNDPGPIVYEVTNIPGEPLSGPLLGEIGPDYPYPIESSAGFTAQQIVDSFFRQGSESEMYLNWHTANNSSGELWAIFNKAQGSIDPPVHPDPPAIAQLSGDALERDIYRFLNQATFGAMDAEVQAIKTAIEDERTTGGNPGYNRIEEYDSWIDAQAGLDQTYLLDYLLAITNQEWKLRDFYNAAEWYDTAEFPDNPLLPPDDPGQTWTPAPIPVIAPSQSPNPTMMPLPSVWPAVDRSPGTTGGNPFQYRFTEDFPITGTRVSWGDDNDNRGDPLQLPRQRYNATNMTYINNQYDKWARRDLSRPADRSRYLIHWMMHVNAHDQLRQKMGFALQQIVVVANTLMIIQDRDKGMANYQDQLNRMAFGNYRDVIDWVMVSPQMGWWLSSFNNQKAADINGDMIIDIFPDENLAREVMQLFTCGLFLLHPDGSLALDSENGLPQATYDNDDITELSRIITGHGYGKHTLGNGFTEYTNFDNPVDNTGNNSFSRGAGDARTENTFSYPMKMFGKYHDIDAKTILGGKLIDNSGLADGTGAAGNNDTDPSWDDETLVGLADMKDALDWLAGDLSATDNFEPNGSSHQSTAPFIAYRLIQRFVTSNPTPAYVERVSEAFAAGEGDLLAAIKAVLLDWEARDPAARSQTVGMKKSPYEAFVHLLRAFDAHSATPLNPYTETPEVEPASYTGNGNYDPVTNPDLYLQNFGYPASQRDNFRLNTQFRFNQTHSSAASDLAMSPMNQTTVFNFYLPDYSPGGIISTSALVSPEMMLANETALYKNINWINNVALSTSAINSSQSGIDLPNVQSAFQNAGTGVNHANNNERIKIDSDTWGPLLYPASGTEFERDTAMFDEMDRRLTGGLFKELYPWDPGDDDDPARDGIAEANPNTNDGNLTNDDEFMNPREAMIRFMGEAFSTTGNGPRDKFRFALALLSSSPDFLVKQ